MYIAQSILRWCFNFQRESNVLFKRRFFVFKWIWFFGWLSSKKNYKCLLLESVVQMRIMTCGPCVVLLYLVLKNNTSKQMMTFCYDWGLVKEVYQSIFKMKKTYAILSFWSFQCEQGLVTFDKFSFCFVLLLNRLWIFQTFIPRRWTPFDERVSSLHGSRNNL